MGLHKNILVYPIILYCCISYQSYIGRYDWLKLENSSTDISEHTRITLHTTQQIYRTYLLHIVQYLPVDEKSLHWMDSNLNPFAIHYVDCSEHATTRLLGDAGYVFKLQNI